ncbi:hypothetical protein A4X13_0g2059 [Tilletia indica]|uniref:Uncharacterized protein n=1 Tax=Tilletia indica TaxID=43049 RepID=A0A177TH95_9BASI|nr:hypothetical protein A4X13_0g2059 [Tilletia indica]
MSSSGAAASSAAADAPQSSDPFLNYTRLNATVSSSIQTVKQTKTELRQLESSIRHNPAQRKQKEQQYNLLAQRVKLAEAAQQEAEERCAASLRALFLSFGGGNAGGSGRSWAPLFRPSDSNAGADDAIDADAEGGMMDSDNVNAEQKPNVSTIYILELSERLEQQEKEIKKMKDHIYNLQNATSSLHDWLLRAAELSESGFHPGSWSGPGSSSAPPLQRTTGRSLPEFEPVLALEDEPAVKRLSKTHLAMLFAAARRGTQSEHGVFQFIPFDPSHPLHQHLRQADVEALRNRAPVSSTGEQATSERVETQTLPAVIPFFSPTPANDPHTMARRIDCVGADLLDVAHVLSQSQKYIDFYVKQWKETESLVQLALLTGKQTRDDLHHLLEALVVLGPEELRQTLGGQSGGGQATSGEGERVATGAVAAAGDNDDDSEDDDMGARAPQDSPSQRASSTQQQAGPSSESSFRVKPEPMD